MVESHLSAFTQAEHLDTVLRYMCFISAVSLQYFLLSSELPITLRFALLHSDHMVS